jgi:hypothetical protein
VFKRLVAGTAWSLVGTLAARGSSFVAMTLAARILGPENYGQFAIVQSLGATAGTVAGSVFGVAATRFLARDIDRDKSRATRIFAIVELAALAVGGVLALAMIVGAPWIAQAIYGQQALAGVIRLSALLLLTNCVASAQIGAFIGLSEFRAYALLSSWQVPLIILRHTCGRNARRVHGRARWPAAQPGRCVRGGCIHAATVDATAWSAACLARRWHRMGDDPRLPRARADRLGLERAEQLARIAHSHAQRRPDRSGVPACHESVAVHSRSHSGAGLAGRAAAVLADERTADA